MPLEKYRENPEEETCAGCKLFPTKPGNIPDEIAGPTYLALQLSEIERSGGKFNYPDALSPFEWSAIAGLTRGRERAENLRQDRERTDRRREERKKKLQGQNA
jgi:hypothetical protein